MSETAARITVRQAAAMFNVSERMVYMARRLLKSGREDLAQAVELGELSMHAALSQLDRPRQRLQICSPKGSGD